MSSTNLLLGPVVFQDFEIPCGINFGGTQRLAVHRLPGGVRVIDAMGRDDANICFGGIFFGDNATLRARVLDEMRAYGSPLPLTWDVFFYTVVISQFRADYTTANWIPYKIICTVLRDEASALIEAAVSLGATVVNDVGSAVTQASAAGIDISSVQSAVADPSATVRDTTSYGLAQTSIAGAQSSLSAGIDNAQAGLSGINIASPGTAASGTSSLVAAVGAAQKLSQLTISQAYIGRAATNIVNAST